MLQQTPSAPAAPTLAPSQVTIAGAPLAGAADIYQGFRAQRRELGRQLDDLQGTRENLSERLVSIPITSATDRKGIEQRMTAIDARIEALDKQIAEADAQVARTAAIPGATIEPPQPPRSGPPDEVFVLAGLFIVVVMLPLTIAYARRIWRRGAQAVSNIPKELSERLMRVEQTVEASAIEIERIGEGQRFMTRLFTEGASAHALPSSVGEVPRIPAGRPGDIRP
jgi:DNA repair exonuclease SbcCD ATPase subunit